MTGSASATALLVGLAGHTTIEARRFGELTKQERRVIELEENRHRKDLTPFEQSKAIVEEVEAVKTVAREESKNGNHAQRGQGSRGPAPDPDSTKSAADRVGLPRQTVQHGRPHKHRERSGVIPDGITQDDSRLWQRLAKQPEPRCRGLQLAEVSKTHRSARSQGEASCSDRDAVEDASMSTARLGRDSHRCGEIVDGRNRMRACTELGIEPVVRNLSAKEAGDAFALVMSLNFHRRHLRPHEKGAALKAYEKHRAKRGGKRQGVRTDLGKSASVADIAVELGISERTARDQLKAHADYESLPPEQREKVDAGEKTPLQAAKKARKAAKKKAKLESHARAAA